MLEEEATVDRRVEPGMRSQLTSIPGWAGLNNPWMPENDGDLDFSYINLINNPERYSGYTVWGSEAPALRVLVFKNNPNWL